MKKFTKHICFNHFSPYYLSDSKKGASSEKLYNLHKMLKAVSSELALGNTIEKQIFGERHRFYKCKYNNKYKIWEIQLLHLRENIIPGIANDAGGYELIPLKDSEYPAESTTALYDEVREILYLQGNHYGTTTNSVEMFLQELSPAGTKVLLKPILYQNRINIITPDSLYRQLYLVVDSDELQDSASTDSNNSLFKTIRELKQYQGRFIKIDINFSRQRTGVLQAERVSKLVHEAYDFNGTKDLKVKRAGSYGETFDTINLLKDRKCYEFTLSSSREHPITHDILFKQCLLKYKEEYNIKNVEGKDEEITFTDCNNALV